MMLGRPAESARLGGERTQGVRRYGLDSTVLVSNYIEALVMTGDWDEADRASAAALRAMTANFPYILLMNRADIEIGRGHFDDARAHLDAARDTLREDRGLGIYDVYLAELALWERRWAEAEAAVRDGLAMARPPHAAQIRVWLCAKGLRAQAELAALAAPAATRPPSAMARPRAQARRRRSPRRRPGLSGHAERRRLARLGRGRVPARAAAPTGPSAGRGRGRPGNGSNVRRSPPTAAGAKPRRSSPPARPAPRRARR